MAEFDKKLVVVLNEKTDTGKVMNALAHAMLGFGAGAVTKEDVKLNKYEDANGGVHDNISEMPIIVLKAKGGQIRTLRQQAIENKLQFVDFTDTMTIGSYEEEYALTKTKKDEELVYLAIILFGPKEIVTKITEKLSLYK